MTLEIGKNLRTTLIAASVLAALWLLNQAGILLVVLKGVGFLVIAIAFLIAMA